MLFVESPKIRFRKRCGFCADGLCLLQRILFRCQAGNSLLLQRLVIDAALSEAVDFRGKFGTGKRVFFELLVDVFIEGFVFGLRWGVLGDLADLLLQANFFLLQRFEVACNFQRIFRGFALRGFLFSDDTFLFGGFFGQHVALFPVGFGCLCLGPTALDVTACRGNGTTQHCATNEAVDVFFAGFWVSQACACLQTLEHLLHGFCETFPGHGRASLGGVVHSGFAQRLAGDRFGLLCCQLGAHGAEQLAHTGQQRHGGSINQCLGDGSAEGCGTAGLLKRLTGCHLSGKVGARELAGRDGACAQQAKCCGSRGCNGGGQSRKTCGCRSNHVRHRTASGLFKFLPRGFSPAFFCGREAGLCSGLFFFLVLLGFRGVHQPRLTGGQCGFAFEPLKACSCGSLETLGVFLGFWRFFFTPERIGVHRLGACVCLIGGLPLTNFYRVAVGKGDVLCHGIKLCRSMGRPGTESEPLNTFYGLFKRLTSRFT